MSVDIDEVAEFVGTTLDDAPLLDDLLTAADIMVREYLRPSGERRIPTEIRDLAVKTLVNELWARRNAPSGVASWSPDGTVPVRLARDTMVVVKPLLDPYRGVGAVG